jgi:hypothetical protein
MIWPDPLGLGLAAALSLGPSFDVTRILAVKPGLVDVIAGLSRPTFKPLAREVSNWRLEAMAGLDRPLDFAARQIAGSGRQVPRCVRLNNYWCIKKAGWAGEIAADSDGHVAFASAREGAMVAAKLLRRYYLDFGRHDALAIVSHWAPAQCGAVALNAAPRAPTRPRTATRLGPVALHDLARFGIGNTLRARWLAAHGRGGTIHQAAKARAVTIHRSVVRDFHVNLKPVAAIMVGEKDIDLLPVSLAALNSFDVSAQTLAQPQPKCAGENIRVRNYAARAIEGIAARPNEDLQLFSADGTPGGHLLLLMVNMAKVEIGPLAARAGLVAAAIEAAFPVKRADAETLPTSDASSALASRR